MGEVQGLPNAYSRSKQNSDAGGMLYQWGRKEPFTFATSSLHNGTVNKPQYGKYPIKLYNSKLELIYQMDDGGSNIGMTPQGGVIGQSIASSMMETIKNPNTFYTGYSVISQVGHSKELWNYNWTSYSRGLDGKTIVIDKVYTNSFWHSIYLDGYIALRSKSIYDPCPYGYRTPTNGTYNDFNSNPRWTAHSYDMGINKLDNWFKANGQRSILMSLLDTGYMVARVTSSSDGSMSNYIYYARNTNVISLNYLFYYSYGNTVRCIEDATVKAVGTCPAARS